MRSITNPLFSSILILLAFISVLTVNYLATALPIGGITTGEASDALPNLFTPAGITFSIWGIIYLLLLGYVLYQLNPFRTERTVGQVLTFQKVGRYFLINALANILWIFAWHYRFIGVSVFIMFVLLFTLIKIAGIVNNPSFSIPEVLFLRLPFSVYFGWITVATIANITAFLVAVDWNGFGVPEEIWTIIILFAGLGIGVSITLKDNNLPYGLVLVWAYFGIYLKHQSETGFNGGYPGIITAIIISQTLFFIVLGFVLFRKIRLRTRND